MERSSQKARIAFLGGTTGERVSAYLSTDEREELLFRRTTLFGVHLSGFLAYSRQSMNGSQSRSGRVRRRLRFGSGNAPSFPTTAEIQHHWTHQGVLRSERMAQSGSATGDSPGHGTAGGDCRQTHRRLGVARFPHQEGQVPLTGVRRLTMPERLSTMRSRGGKPRSVCEDNACLGHWGRPAGHVR